MKSKTNFTCFEDYLAKQLEDPEFAAEYAQIEQETVSRTLADRLTGKIGRVGDGSGSHPIAENHSALFGEIMAEKRKEGHV